MNAESQSSGARWAGRSVEELTGSFDGAGPTTGSKRSRPWWCRWGALAPLCVGLLTACSTPRESPQVVVDLVDLRFEEMGPFESKGLFTFRIHNLSSNVLCLERTQHRLRLNGKLIATPDLKEKLKIPVRGEGTQSFTTPLRNRRYADLIRDVGVRKETGYNLKSVLTADRNGVTDHLWASTNAHLLLKETPWFKPVGSTP